MASLDEIRVFAKEHNCEVVSTEYSGYKAKIQLRCACGNIFEKQWRKLKEGQIRCHDCTSKLSAKSRRKYTDEEVDLLLQQYGYRLVGRYVNTSTPIRCVNDKGEERTALINYLSTLKPKPPKEKKACAKTEKKRTHEPQADDPIRDHVRHTLRKWNIRIRKKYRFHCPVTGDRYTAVHHLDSLNLIVEEAAKELGMECTMKTSAEKFTAEQIQALCTSVRKRHTDNSGILISQKVHHQFHVEYGFGDTTAEDFDKFLSEHYHTSLAEIQKSVEEKGVSNVS